MTTVSDGGVFYSDRWNICCDAVGTREDSEISETYKHRYNIGRKEDGMKLIKPWYTEFQDTGLAVAGHPVRRDRGADQYRSSFTSGR